MIDSLEAPTKRFQLPDGRFLGFTIFGDLDGIPIFFFHGWPGARLQGAIAHEAAKRLGVCYVAVDRPGFGISEFQVNRSILDWPNDISVIADNLGYDRFGVLGLSGGAPYALSCAYKIPHKLLATAIVSGIGPVDAPGAADGVSANNRQRVILAQKAPWLLSLLLRYVMYKRRRDPEGAFTNLLDSLPDVDRKALNDPRVKVMAMAASSDSLRPGIRGHLLEMRLFAHPWRFSQSDIEAQVLLFHGEEDADIYPSTGREQAKAIANCTASFLPGEGHYSLYINRHEEILRAMISPTG